MLSWTSLKEKNIVQWLLWIQLDTYVLITSTRAKYVVASIRAIWQRYVKEILDNLDSNANFCDDIA